MSEKKLKYIFIIFSAILLAVMMLTSRDAGITCDEVLHYNQSVSVFNYFASHGRDVSALNTPVTHLKYYGQSYDNIVTILSKWFGIDDVYGFRHLMSSLAGWLAIMVTALFAIWFAGLEAGIFVVILFAVSPTFLGHSQNNLKDIPFALAYISGTFFTFRFLNSGSRISLIDSILLTLSIAFCISIRAGGLILICYLFLFLFTFCFISFIKEGRSVLPEMIRKLIAATIISVSAYFLSLILWPYALQDPLRAPFESYRVMAHFPDTFRQVFEGKTEWSDFMPWYYLPKYMAITIPLLVLGGLVCFFIFSRAIFKTGKQFFYWFLIFTVFFPLIFVIYEKSNLYSGWRHFMFVYPGIIILASAGIKHLFSRIKKINFRTIALAFCLILATDPLGFMIRNHRYSYLYFNEIVGGFKHAFYNYESDYYFVNHREAAEWLTEYLKKKGTNDSVIVGANFSVEWLFRKTPEVRTICFRNEERSMSDWDFAIMTNRYIPAYQVKHAFWPPPDAIKVIYVEERPISAIIERKSKDAYLGYKSLENNNIKEAIPYFEKAVKIDDRDEMIFYNFAVALYSDGQELKADSMLKKSLELNPGFEPALMYLGNIAAFKGKKDKAAGYYETLISGNRKYFEAYVELAKLLKEKDLMRARSLLEKCLSINPKYKPAVVELADTYMESDPEVAKKYYELAKTLK
jgi:tetratricopeptide (TPR) repeat protein